MEKGWKEINDGGDIVVPGIYKYIIKWVTPLLLIFVFVGSLITPKNNDWVGAFQNGWELDNSSIIKKITNTGLKEQITQATDPAQIAALEEKMFYVSFARILLLAVFIGISFLVFLAYKRRKAEGKIT
jgi:hypothetical protein